MKPEKLSQLLEDPRAPAVFFLFLIAGFTGSVGAFVIASLAISWTR